jgi:ABC-type bacteriocin/lantibiotic exporter with double-glycine peptidase domain
MAKFVFFENVSFRYESLPEPLLHNLNVSFEPGWSGVVGPNGAGKSTVLKLACRLLKPRGLCNCLEMPSIAPSVPMKFRIASSR